MGVERIDPPPVWALMLLFVLPPGGLPGAAAARSVRRRMLGRLLAQQHAAFDHAGMLTTVAALVVLTLAVDLASARIRGALR